MKTHSRQSASKNRIENKSAVLATKLGLIFPAILALLLAASMASAQTETVLYNFDSLTSIGYPLDAPYIDSAGNLYGTAENGRPFLGGVFELSPPTAQGGSWAESLLYGFTSVPDGAFPTSGLVRDSNGALYGQTWMGGTSDYGTVFQLSPPAISGGAWTETTLYTFTDILFSAGYPGSGLIFDKSGNLYGTKGSNSGGLVFELSPPSSSGGTWTYTAIYSFDDQTNFAGGCDPNGLLTGPNGSFYGTASSCGANNGGVVFKLTPPANGVGEWTQTLVHTFSALKTTSDGNVPDSRLVHRKGGVLFGTTYQGGSANLGTVYELTPKTGGTWTERVIHSFHTTVRIPRAQCRLARTEYCM